MSQRLSYIPAGLPFLSTFARGLYIRSAGNPEDLARYHVLLPTRRACRTLRDLFLDQTDGRPLLLPRIQAISDIDDQELDLWVAGVTGQLSDVPPAIAPEARILLMARQILRGPYGDDLAQAVGLAQALATFLDAMEDEGLSLEGLQSLVPENFSEHWQKTLKFLEIIRDFLPLQLAERGVINPAARRSLLLHLLAAYWRDHPPASPVICAGVSGSLPAAAELMKVIATFPQGEVILAGFDPVLSDEEAGDIDVQHPQHDYRRFLAHARVAAADVPCWQGCASRHAAMGGERPWLWRQVMAPSAATTSWATLRQSVDPAWAARVGRDAENIRVFEAETPGDEALGIALYVRSVLAAPGVTVAIVTPDRALGQEISASCARFGIIVNDSAGTPGDQTSLGRFLLLTLRTLCQGFHPVDVLALLHHALLQLPDKNLFIEQLDRDGVRGFRSGSGPIAFLKDAARHGLSADMLTKLEEFLEIFSSAPPDQATKPLAEWVVWHIKLVEQLAGGPENLWRDEEGEALSGFLTRLLDQGDDIGLLTLPDYADLFAQLLHGQAVHYISRDAHARVALLGVFESRLTLADHVVLARFNEGTWPMDPGFDPWLSRSMRSDFGLPPLESAVGRTALDVTLLGAAPRVLMTRCKRQDGTETVPSRWLRRFDTVMQGLGFDPSEFRAKDLSVWVRHLDQPDCVTPSPRPMPTPPPLDPARPLSATALEQLMRNPYDFYARYILRLRPLDDLDPEPDHRIRGMIVHDCLQHFAQGSALDWSVLRSSLDRALAALLPDPAQQALMLPRILVALESYLTQEQTRQAEGYLPAFHEIEGRLSLDVAGKIFTLRARMDRVDRTPRGGYAILDYKTGGTLPTRRDVLAGLSPQLPLEALIFQEGSLQGELPGATRVDQIMLWQVSASSHEQRMWARDDPKYDLVPLIDQARSGVGNLLAYFAGSVSYIALPDPDRAPKFSDYLHLARVDEWSNFGGQGFAE